jgi:rubrerythrin
MELILRDHILTSLTVDAKLHFGNQEQYLPHFAELARAAGDQAAADRFLEIGRDEEKHRMQFQDALDSLQNKSPRKDHPSAP